MKKVGLIYSAMSYKLSAEDIKNMGKNNEECSFRTLKLTLRNKFFISLRKVFVDQSP
jgi:hypothetical protein